MIPEKTELEGVGTKPECQKCPNLEICNLVATVIALADKEYRRLHPIDEEEEHEPRED